MGIKSCDLLQEGECVVSSYVIEWSWAKYSILRLEMASQGFGFTKKILNRQHKQTNKKHQIIITYFVQPMILKTHHQTFVPFANILSLSKNIKISLIFVCANLFSDISFTPSYRHCVYLKHYCCELILKLPFKCIDVRFSRNHDAK